MKSKWLAATGALILVTALGVTLAVWAGRSPVVSDCVGTVPTGSAFAAYRVKAGDGNCLQGYLWAPTAPPRGVLVVVHGLHDHARRYESLARDANALGLAVIAQDLRGHAGSGGAPQRLDSPQQVLADLELARAEAQRRFPGVPMFLYGHSLGGMVAAQAAARSGTASWNGLIVSSAALVRPAGVTAGKQKLVAVLSAIAPNLGLEAVDEALLVREPAARAALAADALIHRAKLPARTVDTLLTGASDLQTRMPTLTVPVLALHGQQDKVTDPSGPASLRALAGAAVKTVKLYPLALHDLLHEPENEDVRQTIMAFLRQRMDQPDARPPSESRP